MVSVLVLGELGLEVHGRVLDRIGSHRARSLLGWLAVHPGLHPRGRVAGAFWPEVLEESARSSLRTALATLKRELGESAAALVTATRDEVGIEPGPEVWIDLLAFEENLSRGDFEGAVALSRGELLADLDDDWVLEEREVHRRRLIEALGRLAEVAEQAGDLDAALERTRRQVALDPLSEEAQQELVRRLTTAGDRAAALSAYQAYGARLQRELGLAPSGAIRELAENVRRGESDARRTAKEALAPLPPMLARAGAGRMVGREAALEQLRVALAGAAEGDLRLALVSGEAGSGKTRLAAEFAREAHTAGSAVWSGRCYEDSSTPYSPFVEALRHQVTADTLPDLPAWTAGELSRLLPELPVFETPPGDSEEARHRLFEAVVWVVANSSHGAPILLVLEDLHWADESTLLMMAHLTRTASSSPILVLGTARNTEPGQDGFAMLVGELARDRRLVRIPVEGLSEAEVGELASVWLKKELPTALAADLHARTGGNPLFAEELLRHAQEAGRLDEDGFAGEVPTEVRQVIGQRVDRLGDRCAEAMTFAAILGDPFELRDLVEATGRQKDDLVESLDGALNARLLRELPGNASCYRFSHDLVRAAVYEDLSAARRSLLHLRVADAIERLYGDHPKRLSELARHLADAGPGGDPERAVRYLVSAAEQAGRGWATAEAIALYNRALALIPEGDRSRRSEVELKRAMAYEAFSLIVDARPTRA